MNNINVDDHPGSISVKCAFTAFIAGGVVSNTDVKNSSHNHLDAPKHLWINWLTDLLMLSILEGYYRN